MAVSDTRSVRTHADSAVLSPDPEVMLGSFHHCKSKVSIRNKGCRCAQRKHFKRDDLLLKQWIDRPTKMTCFESSKCLHEIEIDRLLTEFHV